MIPNAIAIESQIRVTKTLIMNFLIQPIKLRVGQNRAQLVSVKNSAFSTGCPYELHCKHAQSSSGLANWLRAFLYTDTSIIIPPLSGLTLDFVTLLTQTITVTFSF